MKKQVRIYLDWDNEKIRRIVRTNKRVVFEMVAIFQHRQNAKIGAKIGAKKFGAKYYCK